MLDFPINFNFSWQLLTAKTKDFFPFYWDRSAKSVAAIYRLQITFINPPSPPLTHTQCKQSWPWIKMKWCEMPVSAAETSAMQSIHTDKHDSRLCWGLQDSPVVRASNYLIENQSQPKAFINYSAYTITWSAFLTSLTCNVHTDVAQ